MRSRIVVPMLCAAALSFADGAAAGASGTVSFPNGLGFSIGNFYAGSATIGAVPLAISFRKWEGDLGWQAAGGVMYNPTQATNVRFDYWTGVEGLWSLFAAEFSDWFFNRLYVFAEFSHRGYIPVGSYPDYVAGSFHATLGLGAGVGIEFGLFQHFSSTFEAGYGVFWDPANGSDIALQLSVPIIAQASLHYRF